MTNRARTVPLPEGGARGLLALVELGTDAVGELARRQASEPLTLALPEVIASLAHDLETAPETLESVFLDALIPLNGIRRTLGVKPIEFIEGLDHTVASLDDSEFGPAQRDEWKRIVPQLPPLFSPDNFFAQVSKAVELLSQRSAVMQQVKILTELRPIYDEATSKTLAVLHTHTMVLNYWDGQQKRVLHLTLDNDDLCDLEDEIERARSKFRVSSTESNSADVKIVAYGRTLE